MHLDVLAQDVSYAQGVTLWEIVIPSAITAVATICAVFVTSQHALRVFQANMMHDRIQDDRHTLASVAFLMDKWSRSHEVLLAFYADASASDMAAFMDTESGQDNRVTMGKILEQLAKAKLTASTKQVRALFGRLNAERSATERAAIHTLVERADGASVAQSRRVILRFKGYCAATYNEISETLDRQESGKRRWGRVPI